MKFRKHFAVLLALCMLACLFAGCAAEPADTGDTSGTSDVGGADAPDTGDTSSTTDVGGADAPEENGNGEDGERVIVQIWHTYTGDQAAYLEQQAAAFNESQNEYEVQVLEQAYNGFEDTVYNAVANGVGPSIIFNYASTAVDYIEAGLAVNIQTYIDEDEAAGDTTMADYIDSLPESMKTDVMGFADGGIYYLPGCTTGPIFFYNKTMYDALGLTAPTTWDELAANCEAIYNEYGIAGYLADGLVDDIQALLMQNGEGYIDVETKTVEFGGEGTVEIFQWFADNVAAGYFALSPTNDYASDDFSTQLVAGFSGSCVNDQYIYAEDFEFAMAPWIASAGEAFYTAWNRGPIFLKASDEAIDRGAYEFVKFFLSPEINAGWAQVNSALSPYGTTEANEDYQAYLENVPESLQCVQANLDASGSFPNIPGASQLRDLLEEYLTYAASGQMTAQEAVDGLVTACNAALAG